MSAREASVSELHSKAARHARIVSVLNERTVRSQAELAAILAGTGFTVTQATLSRDLDELGAVKLRSPDGGLPVYVVPEDGAPLTSRSSDDAPAAAPGPADRRDGHLGRGERQPGRPAHASGRGGLPRLGPRSGRHARGSRHRRRR